MAVLGVGSGLRGDDAVGLLALDCLRALLKARPARMRKTTWKLIAGGTAPENMTGAIRRFKPDALVVIDAADMGATPGFLAPVDMRKITGAGWLTHKLPLKLMLDYLGEAMSFKQVFIGIQPGRMEFGAAVSDSVVRAARRAADLLASFG